MFGNQLARTGTTDIDHRYRGEQVDPNTGFYNLRARWYDPSSGRFTSMDSWMGNDSDPVSLHKYLYGNSDSINYADPSGQFSMSDVGASLRVLGHMAAIGIPTINAGQNIQAGMSLGDATLRMAGEVAIGYAGGAVLGRLTRFVPSILPIRGLGRLSPAGGRLPGSMWNSGIAARGEAAELAVLGGNRSLPWNYPVIDDFAGNVATSIKSMDLTVASASYMRRQMLSSAEKLNGFVPRNWGASGQLAGQAVNGRTLVYVFEPGAADAVQAAVLKQVAQEVRTAYPGVKLVFQWVP